MNGSEPLGYTFRDPAWLERAMTHASYRHERADADVHDYERLEFLGDALLGFVVSDVLFKGDAGADEGVLTKRRQAVVRRETLAAAGNRLGLGERIRLGRGEETSGGRERLSTLADAFEALVAAVYLDGGLRAARAFIARHLRREIHLARSEDASQLDFKTRFQENVQALGSPTPRYRIVEIAGPAHARVFRAEVVVGESVCGRGEGSSRKSAEQEAARAALAASGLPK